MADIIRLNGDSHAQTQHLLPWYVTGALAGKELAIVETHLAECAECREDAEIEKTLARHVRTLPCDVERGWRTLKTRLEGPRPLKRRIPLFGRRISIGWALAAQAASLAVLVPLVALAPVRPPLLYRTLGSVPAAAPGNLIVVFQPKSSEASVRAVLVQNQARIVDGPTAADAYVLHVAADRRAAVLARLQSDPNIWFAEAIGGADR
ncbi:MAG: zf-HC2 domain-containing protein [Caulobacteraceae bacterium]